MSPVRIQRRRTKGWRMPDGAVYVGRGTYWGNFWRVGDTITVTGPSIHPPYPENEQYVRELVVTPAIAVALYEAVIGPDQPYAIQLLGGRDLACWCPTDQPCHADILLKLANPEPEGGLL